MTNLRHRKPYGFVYLTWNDVNDVLYIGKHKMSFTPADNQYLGSGSDLIKAIKEIGRQHFHKRILQYHYTEDGLNFAEAFWIEKYVANIDDMFYNIMDGGGSQYVLGGPSHPSYGRIPTEETRRKLSESLKKIVKTPEWCAKISAAEKGKIISQETRDKLSKINTGKHHTEESRLKMSNSRKGVPKSLEHRAKISASEKGKIVSEESKAKMSESQLARKYHHTEEYKDYISELFSGKNNSMYGKHHSDETRAKMSAKAIADYASGNRKYSGHVHTEEENRHHSEMLKGLMVGELNPNYGNHMTEESKAISSEKNSKYINVYGINIKTGEKLGPYKNLSIAAEVLGLKSVADLSKSILHGKGHPKGCNWFADINPDCHIKKERVKNG